MREGPGVLYVCDETRANQMRASIASWRRYEGQLPITIVDIGLAPQTRASLQAEPLITVTPLYAPPPLKTVLECTQRVRAYRTKARMGKFEAGDPVIFLDTDIIVVHNLFFRDLLSVPSGAVSASRSAWDTDFHWTYTDAGLALLKSSCGVPAFDPHWLLPNSGVVAARLATLSVVSDVWASMFDAFIHAAIPAEHCHPGTMPGDQEFLALAIRQLNLDWIELHGAHNMQVHHRRMPWSLDSTNCGARHPLGNHHGERPRPVLAIHYGLEDPNVVSISDKMLPSEEVRTWIAEAYRKVGILAYSHAVKAQESA